MKNRIIGLCAGCLIAITGCSAPATVTETLPAPPTTSAVVETAEAEPSPTLTVKPVTTPKPSETPKASATPTKTAEVKPTIEETSTQTEKPREPEETAEQPKEPTQTTPTKELESTGSVTVQTPQETPKPVSTPEPTPTPAPTPEPTPTPTPEPTPTPTPEPTPEPVEEIKSLGSGYSSDVLAGVNEVRALQGNPPLTLDSGLSAKALDHAKEMARQGKIFHAGLGAESVSRSTESGKQMGIASAAHATQMATDPNITKLGVGAVTYNGKQWTCVVGR